MTRRITYRLADCCASLLVFLLVSIASFAWADGEDGIVRVKSAVSMPEAITRIKADVASKGIKFFMEIDQSRLAADAGSGASPMARTTAKRRAPAPCTPARFATSMPPMANHGRRSWPRLSRRAAAAMNSVPTAARPGLVGVAYTGPAQR